MAEHIVMRSLAVKMEVWLWLNFINSWSRWAVFYHLLDDYISRDYFWSRQRHGVAVRATNANFSNEGARP